MPTRRLLMADNGPDWGQIGAAAVTVAGVLATAIAGARGVFSDRRSDRQKENDREDARQALRDKASIDHTAMTLDSVFKLVEELQEEVARRGQQVIDTEARCAARVDALERRIVELEREAAALREEKARGWQAGH